MKTALYRMTAAAVAVLFFAAIAVAPAAAADPAKVAGTWEMTSQGQNGPRTSTLKIEQDGANIKGTIQSNQAGQGGQGGPPPARNFTGTMDGKNIKFTVTFEGRDGTTRSIEYTGTVDGDSMKGSVQMGQNPVEWTAKKKP